MGIASRWEARAKGSRLGWIFVLVGLCYLIVPFQAARTCLGMECLEFLIAGLPVNLLSVPWSLPAHYWLVPDPEAIGEEIYRGQMLHAAYWPRYAVISAGFLFNLFLVGTGVEWLWRRRGRSRPGRVARRALCVALFSALSTAVPSEMWGQGEESAPLCIRFDTAYFGWGALPHMDTTLVYTTPDIRLLDVSHEPDFTVGARPDARRVEVRLDAWERLLQRYATHSYWARLPSDSLEIVWATGLVWNRFALVEREDSLVGMRWFSSDTGPLRPEPAPTRGVWIDCPDGPVAGR